MGTLIVNIVTKDKTCLVIGGGTTALRKVKYLIEAHAKVTVISPELIKDLEYFTQKKLIIHKKRKYLKGDLSDYFLVIAATNDTKVNKTIFDEARIKNILCNVVDDPQLCTFYFPSTVNKGQLQFAIASHGSIPYAVKRFRIIMESMFNSDDWDGWWKQASTVRKLLLNSSLPHDTRNDIFDFFFDKTVQSTGDVNVEMIPSPDWEQFLVELNKSIADHFPLNRSNG